MEPPVHDDDALPSAPTEEQPRTSIPTVIGLLNIIFGSLLSLCIICSSFYMMIQVAIGAPMMAVQQQQLQVVIQAERQKKLQQLQEQEKAAKDEKERADLQARQKELEAQPIPKMPDFTRFIRNDEFQIYVVVDYLTGFVLNIIMLISGIALMRLKEWGRITAIWVAIVKILRLIALNAVFALVVVPVMVKDFTSMMREFIDEMAKAAPPGQPMPAPGEMAQVGTILGIVSTVTAIGMVIFGAIYPMIVVITLTQARVKAACVSSPAKTVGPSAPTSEA